MNVHLYYIYVIYPYGTPKPLISLDMLKERPKNETYSPSLPPSPLRCASQAS